MRIVKPADVMAWHYAIDPSLRSSRSQAYALVRSLFAQAIQKGVRVADNPCRIRGAGVTRRERSIEPLTIGRPKSDAGLRKMAVPPHVVPALRDHVDRHVGRANNALLFATRSGLHWIGNFYRAAWVPAREAIGMPNLRFHDLRHTPAVLAAQTGATLAELMSRLGHSTSVAALRYQHAAQGRDAAIAEAMSAMAAERADTVIALSAPGGDD